MAKRICNKCQAENVSGDSECFSCGGTYFKYLYDEEPTVSEADFEIILTTTSEIPGREIERYIGLVFGAGNAAWTVETTSERTLTAMKKAEQAMTHSALLEGADAIVGITFSMDSSGQALNRSQAITLLGTAVKLKN